jgi:hypothetical protein
MVFNGDMAFHGDYEPGSAQKVHEQAGLHGSLNGVRGTSLQGFPVVILTVRGARSATRRKASLIRAKFEDLCAVRASSGGALRHPSWYFSLGGHPFAGLKDDAVKLDLAGQEFVGDECSRYSLRTKGGEQDGNPGGACAAELDAAAA